MGRKNNGNVVRIRPNCNNCNGNKTVEVPSGPVRDAAGMWVPSRSMKTVTCPDCNGSGKQ